MRPTSCTSRGASPSDGSSINKRSGLLFKARAIASICCSPPLRYLAFVLMRSARLGKRDMSFSIDQPSLLSRSLDGTMARFSLTVREGKMRRPCGTKAKPIRAMRKGSMPVMSTPLKRICPLCGGVRPMIELMVVVLPIPFLPRRATAHDLCTLRDNPWRI